jgi:cytochrome c peroxidase
MASRKSLLRPTGPRRRPRTILLRLEDLEHRLVLSQSGVRTSGLAGSSLPRLCFVVAAFLFAFVVAAAPRAARCEGGVDDRPDRAGTRHKIERDGKPLVRSQGSRARLAAKETAGDSRRVPSRARTISPVEVSRRSKEAHGLHPSLRTNDVAHGVAAAPPAASVPSGVLDAPNPSGVLRTITLDGAPLDRSNPFFQSLGTNGRSCVSCHVPSTAWTISPLEVQHRFMETQGLDPIFRTVDGSNSPYADVSTVHARSKAFSMLLNKGVIRIGLPIPEGAEFALVAVDDPYHYASASELSLFRRPIPSTNLRFLTAVMWDGRESFAPLDTTPILSTATPAHDAAALFNDLKHQANDATMTHAQAAIPLTDEVLEAIVQFELNLATAQQHVHDIGALDIEGAQGGPAFLAMQPFYVTINDVLGADKTGAPFDPRSMTLYDAWAGSALGHRADIARGAALFSATRINITGVGGLNDELGLPVIKGSCTTCHDTPNVGNHSVALPIDIGVTDPRFRTPDMPEYTLQNLATGELRKTTDPGRALLTGKWQDIGKFKGPVLRGLAARAPYFHNGMAADLNKAVEFYNQRFSIGFTPREKADLVAFLNAL